MHIRQTLSEIRPPKPTITGADFSSLEGRKYLVTGGAAGIGKELARILYSANATVYIAGRNPANIEKATKEIKAKPSGDVKITPTTGHIIPVILDLGDLTTINPAVDKLREQTSKLDAVFLNAGVMLPPAGSKTSQGYELQWGTNVVGHFLLQKLLLPLVMAPAQDVAAGSEARIIWVSSDAANMTSAPDGINWADINGEKKPTTGQWAFYCQSKAANVILAAETARRYGAHGVVAASLNPGHLKTDLQRHMSAAFLIRPTLYEARYGAYTELFAGFSPALSRENNGRYLIPWGRIGLMAEHIEKGLENGSGARLWDLLEKETAQYT